MDVDMSAHRWTNTCAYLRDVFGNEDEQLRTLMARAVAAGLPDIAVSSEVGRLLLLLTSMCNEGRGAAVAIELGTLAGYSGIWIARGLAPGGRLITVEPEPRHADFAARELVRAGIAGSVEIRRATALEALPALASELGPASVDLAFLDAVKTEYAEYFRLLRPLLKPGGLLLADNALGSGSWWIDDTPGAKPERDAIDRFNRLVAADPAFTTACVPARQGLLIAMRVRR
jgi:predicted O-methyltransferase YrrM